MRFILNINQPKAMEWGLTLPQAILFSYLHELPTWAKSRVIDGETFYWAGKSNILCELPILTDKPDTIKRHMSALEKLDLIKRAVHQNRMMICVTEKGKTWNKFSGDLPDSKGGIKIPPIDLGGDKNPPGGGKLSPTGGDKNPPDQYIKDPILDHKDNNGSIRQIDPQDPSIENAFETIFWPVWEGRKIARGECLAIFSFIAAHESDPQQFAQELVADIQRRRGSGQHGFDKMHPKSYLKGRHWEGRQLTSAPAPSAPRKANALDFSHWPTQPSKQVLDDWNLIRNKKRAPLTQTAVDRLRPKLELAQQRLNLTVDDVLGICVERGWQSFEVEWLEKHINAGGLPVSSSPPLGRQSALEARSRSAIEQWLDKSGNTYDHEG